MHEAFIRVWDKRTTVEGATLKGLLYKTVQNVGFERDSSAQGACGVPAFALVRRFLARPERRFDPTTGIAKAP